MEYLNSPESADQSAMEEQFKRVMAAAKSIMGKYAFRKLGEDKIRRPINKAIYEAWCRSLYGLENVQIALLEQRRDRVYHDFLGLCNDPGFLQAIKASDKKSFFMRFTYVNDMLRGILNDTKN